MKQYLPVAIAFLILVSVISCKKDNNSESPLMGKWFFKTTFSKEYTNGVLTDTSTYYLQGNSYYDFAANNVLNIKDENGFMSVESYSYDESSKKLTTVDGAIQNVFDVTVLTSTNLTLHYQISDTFPTYINRDEVDYNFTK